MGRFPILISFLCVLTHNKGTHTLANMSIRSVDFEVFGVVQGVFFRKYTKSQADKLDRKGEKVDNMIQWLKTTGSPSSRIDKAEFKNDKQIAEYTFNGFDIRRDN